MGTDTRLALRRLAATPLFTAFAILSLAAGVAITTAMYSIVDGVFLRGQGIRDPDRLAVVVTPYSGRLMTGVVSEPDFRDLQAAQTSFTHLSASATSVRRLASPSVTQMMIGEAVSGSYFATLGVGAALGRPIQPADDDAHARVVMLSDTLWRRRFSSDSRVVGTTVSISGERFEVIGVAPASFSGPRGWLVGTQFWIPLGTESQLKESPRSTTSAAPRATARDDRRRIGGPADHRRAARRVVSAAIPWQGRRRHGSPVARKDHGGDLRRRGLRRAPVRDDARGARRAGAGRRLHEPRQPRARPRKYPAARARRAARPRRIEVAARARTVSRERDAGGRRRSRVLRHIRAVARRAGRRVQPRHAFRRPYHAVVSSRAERAGADDRGLVAPHRARRLRPRAGDSADPHARRSRRARRRVGRRTAARPAPAASPAVAGRHRGRVLHHRHHVR